jgi:hypothetical protein
MVWTEGMLDAFERVGWGALLIGADGRVINLNGEARRHVGSEITLAQGQIAATHRTSNAELKHRIAETLSADNRAIACDARRRIAAASGRTSSDGLRHINCRT